MIEDWTEVPSGWIYEMVTLWLWLTVHHGKIHHAIKFGKPSISIRAMASMAMLVITRGYLVGGLEHEFYFPFHIWVVIRNPLTNSYFSEGQVYHQPVILGGFLKWRYPNSWLDGLFHGESVYKWMITRGTPHLRKPPNMKFAPNISTRR